VGYADFNEACEADWLVAGLEILHFSGTAGSNPFRKAGELGEFVDGRDPGEVEAGGESRFFHLLRLTHSVLEPTKS
jgi:hypothetical protein